MPGLQPCLGRGRVITGLAIDLMCFLGTSFRSRTALAAENLFLRKQLALYRERQVKPRRASDPLRLTLGLLARWFAWREALTIVQCPAGHAAPLVPRGVSARLALAVGYIGTRHLTTKNVAAKKPADLKGLRIRVPEIPVYRDMVAAWGATPTPIPMAEVFTSLQSGIVEGEENPFAQILSNRFYEVQRYLILTSHITQCGSIIFNERLFQQQPKEYQRALTESAQEAMDWFLEYLTAQEGKMLEQLKGHGIVVVEPDQAAFREAMRPVYEKYDGIWTRELREKIQSYR